MIRFPYSRLLKAAPYAALAACAALSAPAAASPETTAQPRPNVAVDGASPFDAPPIDDAGLRKATGRENIAQHSQADLTANVSRNSVGDNAVTGDAMIADNAFQNMSGLSILNVNTGNNVAINAAMNVNIAINPGT
ncbi:MAG: hypothetical protein WA948_01180 [Pontixanthobacter sp.]